MQQWTILKLLEWTTNYFTKYAVPNPRLDAELLLAHTLNKKRIDLYLSFDLIVGEKDLATFKEYIQRRSKREPLQYITGVQEFWGIPIKVTPDVLIPRPETELLVEEVIKKSPKNILDLCTGSGAIIAALASELHDAHFIGSDIMDAALVVAKENIKKWEDRVTLLKGDLFSPITNNKPFDVITANPPYVAESELPMLQQEVKDFEPKKALVCDEDGLAIIKRIINDAYKFLKPNGWLVMEIGDKHTEVVRELIAKVDNYGTLEFIKDYSGIERIVVVQTHG